MPVQALLSPFTLLSFYDLFHSHTHYSNHTDLLALPRNMSSRAFAFALPPAWNHLQTSAWLTLSSCFKSLLKSHLLREEQISLSNIISIILQHILLTFLEIFLHSTLNTR